MSLDIRSRMAINMIVNMGLEPYDSFVQLAEITKAWGMGFEESFPLADELRKRLGLTGLEGRQKIRAMVDGQEIVLRRMN